MRAQNKPSFEVAPQKPPAVATAQTSVTPSSIFAGDKLTISTKVTDVSGVASVSAYIVLSGSDVRKLTLNKTTGDVYKIDWQTPTDLTPGTYTVDIEANDTLGYFNRNTNLGTFTVNASCSTSQCSAAGHCYTTNAGLCHPTDPSKACTGLPASWTGYCGDNKCQCGENATNCALDCGVVGCDNPQGPDSVTITQPATDYPAGGSLPSQPDYIVKAEVIPTTRINPIREVEFYLDGVLQSTQNKPCEGEDIYCWIFDTTTISGEYDIRVIGFTSDIAWCDTIRHINIEPVVQNPTANITDPLLNATLSGTYGVKMHATDNIGVNKIELYTNEGGLINTVNVSPASTDTTQTINWDTTTYPNGNYNLFSIAYDADNNWSVSIFVPVKVDNPCPAGQCKIWPNCYAAGACHPTTASQKCDVAGSGNWVSSCNDTSCNCRETNATCSADCPPTVCGANGCEVGETCSNCPADCGLCAAYQQNINIFSYG